MCIYPNMPVGMCICIIYTMYIYQCACGYVSLSFIKYEVHFYCFQYHKERLRFHPLYLPKEYEMFFFLFVIYIVSFLRQGGSLVAQASPKLAW